MAIWIAHQLMIPVLRYKGEEYFSDENHYANFINFTNTKNAWVRNMTALHFVSSVVQANAGTKWITVQDCESREPVSVRAGGRRFTFQMNGQFCLVQRCFSQKGRHSFVLQGSEASGNVFFDCKAVNPYSTSEPHNRWVNGVLYDNVKAPLTARFWKDFIIGWAGANIVFWNCEGEFRNSETTYCTELFIWSYRNCSCYIQYNIAGLCQTKRTY